MCLVEDRMGCFLMKGQVKIIEKKMNSFSSCILKCHRIKGVLGFCWKGHRIIVLLCNFK